MATPPTLTIPKYVSLKNHPDMDEKWLHNRLNENPELLGLGELMVRDYERRQPTGGRLDMLLEDVEQEIRYEVEIQLGAVDESHIIRTIEYWDIERRRYPQYEHIAVIVAEDVTTRFLNVISLFNGTIPLIAIQLKAIEVNGTFTLVATRVLGVVRLGTEEEDAGETVDRAHWEQKTSSASLKVMDSLITLINEVVSGIEPRYNKHFIGLTHNGQPNHFVIFGPRKNPYALTEFKAPEDAETSIRLNDSGLKYDTKNGRYRVWVYQNDLNEHRQVFVDLITKSHDFSS